MNRKLLAALVAVLMLLTACSSKDQDTSNSTSANKADGAGLAEPASVKTVQATTEESSIGVPLGLGLMGVTFKEVCSKRDGFCVNFPRIVTDIPGSDPYFENSFDYQSKHGGDYFIQSYNSAFHWTELDGLRLCVEPNTPGCESGESSYDAYRVFVWTPNDPNLAFEKQIDGCNGRPGLKVTKITLDGEDAIRAVCYYPNSSHGVKYLTLSRHEGRMYALHVNSPHHDPFFTKQFFDSFRFLE